MAKVELLRSEIKRGHLVMDCRTNEIIVVCDVHLEGVCGVVLSTGAYVEQDLSTVSIFEGVIKLSNRGDK